MTKVLIDNGHGVKTAGKRSPDGRLLEGVYAREIARRLGDELEERSVPYALITPELDDTPLSTRVYRANSLHRQNHGSTILLSLHSDASARSGWSDAMGFSVRLSQNASQRSKTLARCLFHAAEQRGIPVRKYNGDVVPWWPQNLAICRDTVMPAVLVEMFFHTNKEQVEWALSPEGRAAIVGALTDAVCTFIL